MPEAPLSLPPPGQRTARAAFWRINLRALILPALWLAFTVWTGWQAIENGQAFFAAPSDQGGSDLLATPADGLFALNIWSCAAALFLGLVIVANPFRLKWD